MPAEQHGDFQNSRTGHSNKRFVEWIIALQRLAVEMLAQAVRFFRVNA